MAFTVLGLGFLKLKLFLPDLFAVSMVGGELLRQDAELCLLLIVPLDREAFHVIEGFVG